MSESRHESLVASLAARLRLVAGELADATESERGAHLEQELARGLEGLSPVQRDDVLRALRKQFPSLGGGDAGSGAAPASASGGMDLEGALACLEREAASLSSSDRSMLAARLARAGINTSSGASSGGGAVSPEQADRVREVLRVEGEVDADRVASLAAILADALIKLDRASWTAWSEIAPRSGVRHRMPLERVFRQYLEGDEETPRVKLEEDVELTRRLAALLVGSTGKTGQWAWEHVRQIRPSEIEVSVGSGKHKRLWQVFEEQAAEVLTSHSVEGHMRSFLRDYVEDVIRRQR